MIAWEVQAYDSAVLGPYSSSYIIHLFLQGRIGLETKLRMKGHLGFRSLASYFVHIEEDNLAAQAGARAALLPREESAAQQQGGSSAQSGAPAQTSP